MISTLTVDDLQFEVRWSDKRRTLGLTVDREGELVISAPTGSAPTILEDFVREKKFWLYTKLAEKNGLGRPVARKEFKSGEGFSYLGRSYRLLLVDGQDVPLRLFQGRFRLLRDAKPRGREHFVRWYTEHALPWLDARVTRFAPRMGVNPSNVAVRDLGFRWGSCGASGTVNFHWATILLPPSIIDYVLVHELAHMTESNHTPGFWLRVERAMPDFRKRKQWLAQHGMGRVTI